MANTYTLISSVTVGSGGAATIDFTSIPSTYTDLNLIVSLRGDRSAPDTDVYIKLNNSTTTYSFKILYGNPDNGTPVGSFSGASYPATLTNAATATASTFSNASIYFPNYAGSTNKSLSADSVSENNSTNASAYFTAGLWSTTSAINQITFTPYTGNFVQYSTAYLYGISNA
jgi:hypothetical protein